MFAIFHRTISPITSQWEGKLLWSTRLLRATLAGAATLIATFGLILMGALAIPGTGAPDSELMFVVRLCWTMAAGIMLYGSAFVLAAIAGGFRRAKR